MTASTKKTLYRIYDENDALLYVGVSNNVGRRIGEHSAKDWFNPQSISRVEMEHFSSEGEALAAETLAIKAEKPLNNIKQASVVDRSKIQSITGVSSAVDAAIGITGNQNILAHRAKVSQATISCYLTGKKKPKYATALRLSEAVGGKISWMQFMGVENDRGDSENSSRSITIENSSTYSIFDFAQGKPGISPLATHCTDAWEPRHSLGGA